MRRRTFCFGVVGIVVAGAQYERTQHDPAFDLRAEALGS